MASAPILATNAAGIVAHKFAIALVGKQLALLDSGNVARINDDVGFEVENFLQLAQGNVEQVTDARRQSLEEPNVRAGAGQINVT